MAKRGIGTKLKKIVDGATPTETPIAELTEINGLDLSADTIDTTALDSVGGYRTFIGGFKDGGDVTVSGFFNPQDVGQKGLYDDFESGATIAYEIEFPAELGATWQFDAVVTNYSTSVAVEDAINFEATLKVSGKPTLTIVAPV